MPKEVRYLIFSMLELREIAALHLRAQRRLAADCSLTIGKLEAEPEVRLRIDLGHGAGSESLWLAGPELAAALIRYCRQRKLPLPARAGKWLQTTPDGLVFGISSGVARKELARLLGAGAAAD